MDLISVLEDAIGALPPGSHISGLRAILRHVRVAVRHHEGGKDPHSDRFTDAIYRTNQAYEGSLKEAYRVLAGKDPSRKSPSQIEKYLEDNKILRDRVLVQITRYRQDYRNPSTHDHKLDFDADEALLAIVSICAFAKLLIDQIAGKLAFDTGADAATGIGELDSDSSSDLSEFVAKAAQTALDEKPHLEYYSQLDGYLSGYFERLGFEVTEGVQNEVDDEWDLFISKGDFGMPIETRKFAGEFDPQNPDGLGYLQMALSEEGRESGLLLVTNDLSGSAHKIFIAEDDHSRVYVVTHYALEEVKRFRFINDNTKVEEFNPANTSA